MTLVDIAVKRPVTVWMFTFAVILFGMVGFSRLSLNLLPELSYPTLTVRTLYPGAAPTEVEQLISKPVEEAVGIVKGLRKISSISRAGQSDVLLEFDWDSPMDLTSLEVREKLDLITLPLDVKKPLLLRFNPSLDPILRLGLQTEDESVASLKSLRTYADQEIKRQLESLPGVASVKLGGGLEQEYQVLLDQHKLSQLNIDSQAIINRIQTENVNVSAGKLIDGDMQYLVRTLNQFTSLDEMAQMVIYRDGKQIVRLQDIATIVDGYKQRTDVTRINSSEAVELAIYKEGDANTVAVAQAVKGQLENLREQLGEQLSLDLVYDQSQFINNAINEVKSAAIVGGILAMAILYLFLRSLLPTLIISISIPVSVIATFNLMYANDISLNIMSLGGIALAVGLLVDNAIVVLENIARHREQGLSPLAAASRGTKEVAGAITASTLTTLAVFVPLVFVEGIAGQLFSDQALTVTFALLASLIVALTLIPMLASRERRHHEPAPRPEKEKTPGWRGHVATLASFPFVLLFNYLPMLITRLVLVIWRALSLVGGMIMRPVTAAFNWSYDRLASVYRHSLKWALAHRLSVIIISLGLAAGSSTLVPKLGVELLPPLAQGEFYLEIDMAPGTPLAQTDATLNRLALVLADDPRVKTTASLAGSGSLMSSSATKGGEHWGRLQVILHDPADEVAVMDKLRAHSRRIAGIDVDINRPVLFTFNKPVSIELTGHDLDELKQYSQQLAALMTSDSRFVDVTNSLRQGQPELAVHFNHAKLAELGFNAPDVANRLAIKIGGSVASKYSLWDRKIDILVRSDEQQRNSISDIREMIVNPDSPRPIPLYAVADVTETVGPAEINRVNQQRVAILSANIAYGDLGEATEQAKALIAQLQLPFSVQASFGGQNEEMENSFNSLLMALALAVFLVYLVMASQFESLLHPLLILFSVPLAGIGSILGLYLTQTHISVIVFIGLIMLAGIVVNNAIVLVDRINQLREQGVEKTAAILEAAQSRLRPIVMTTLTTTLGLAPLALGLGEGAELRAPMAITVISGLLLATLLTLVLIPVLYRQFDNKTFEPTDKEPVNA